METESVSEMSDFINLMTQPSALENLTEFCSHESFKTYMI